MPFPFFPVLQGNRKNSVDIPAGNAGNTHASNISRGNTDMNLGKSSVKATKPVGDGSGILHPAGANGWVGTGWGCICGYAIGWGCTV